MRSCPAVRFPLQQRRQHPGQRLLRLDAAGAFAESGQLDFPAVAQVLQEMLDHHIKEEEHGIFAELAEHFSAEQREAMGADFVARKRKLLTAHGVRFEKAA